MERSRTIGKTKVQSIACFALAVFFTLFYLGSTTSRVRADMGPKPSITVNIQNPPSGTYYVALLSKKQGVMNLEDLYREKRETCPEDVLETLAAYNEDGFSLYLDPVGENILSSAENRSSFRFWYMVPTTFKVAIVTEDLQVITSPVITKTTYNSVCTYDISANTITEKPFTAESLQRYFYAAGWCLLATLVVEFIVMLCFRLMKIKNFLHFLLINLITQILLNSVLLGTGGLRVSDELQFIIWAITEILIIVIEALYYKSKLKNKEGDPCPTRGIAFGITANIVSLLCETPFLLLMFIYA
ncbi:MAG: hypothetical protein J6Y08_03170 [Clostridiales bacterium]|nr:hypothetical protein [Clostridiales bacterium]